MPSNLTDRLSQWIVDNEDKKGTPEFITVAGALKEEMIMDEGRGPAPDPTADMSGFQKFAAGVGKGMTDVGRGIGDITGYYSEKELEQAKERDAPLMATGAGQAGNITGKLAVGLPSMLIPGANTVAGASMIGAGYGALEPTSGDESRLMNTALGAGGGYLGSKVGNVFNPKVDPKVAALMDEGITPTPGQIMGGTPRNLESGIGKSTPFVRDAVQRGEERAGQQFNAAAINRSLAPLDDVAPPVPSRIPFRGDVPAPAGPRVTKGGHESLEFAHNQISKAYDDLLPKLKVVQDAEFGKDFDGLVNMTYSMADDTKKIFDNVIDRDVLQRFTTAGRMSGESMKDAESVLGSKAAQYMKSMDPQHRELGMAFREAQRILRTLTERSNPQFQGQLKSINTAYANLLRAERAASSVGAKEGVFTPSQLHNAVKALDPSKGKRQFAQGNAMMQDLSGAGKSVLNDALPDSGTPFRANALLSAAMPWNMAGQFGTSTMMNPVTQKAMAAALTSRPELSRQFGRQVSKFTKPVAGGFGAPLAMEAYE